MKKLSLPIHPREAVARLVRILPSKRLREVLERRFGLRGKESETLEAIGRSFGVTRERVRQIEAEALRRFAQPSGRDLLAPIATALEGHFDEHGRVFEEARLLQSVAPPRYHNHVAFLLTVADPFEWKREEEAWHNRWFTREESLKAAQSIIARTADELGGIGKPVAASALFEVLKRRARETLGTVPGPDALESYLSISKLIAQNPYGEFGLVSWSTIRPRGVKDKAYAVLAKSGAPLHFRDVASAIARSGWSSRRVHPQTVHNELIKDPRFILVGRGLYALAEWGYEPGTVSDVIASILKAARRPIPRGELLGRVLEQRFVKPTTVFLNLQNRHLFKRTPEGYTLA